MWFGKGSAAHVQHTLTCLILSVSVLPFRYELVSHQKSRGREVVKQAKPILILNSVSKYYENKMHIKLQNKNTLII